MPETAGRAARRENIRRGKRRRAAAVAMFLCLAISVICLLICAVQAIVYAINGPKPLKPGESEPPAVEPTLTDTAYGPLQNDALTISSPYIPYDYSAPAPAITAVSDSYFADALFVGDLRFAELAEDMTSAELLLSGGVTAANALEREFTFGEGTATLAARLAARQYGSIYLAFGPNELGWGYPSEFINAFTELITAVRASQPEADIYICGLWPFSDENAAAVEYHSAARVKEYNSLLLTLARDTRNPFLDLAEVFSDADGGQTEGSTTDGFIPTEEYSDKLYQYLKTHTVSKEYYGN